MLVEGPTDVAALSTATARTRPPEATAQTDFVECGGSSEVALWLEVCTSLGLDVRAVADLDAVFSSEVQRAVESRPGVNDAVAEAFTMNSTKTWVILGSLVRQADQENIGPTEKERAKWLSGLAPGPGGLGGRRDKLLETWRQNGLWLHPQGDLEEVLGLSPQDKHVENARRAAGKSGAIDAVAEWAAHELDVMGDVLLLLDHQVEVIAHKIMEAQELDPHARGRALLGAEAQTYERLVDVGHDGENSHQITVKVPEEYAGYRLVFSRETPSTDLRLREPGQKPGAS